MISQYERRTEVSVPVRAPQHVLYIIDQLDSLYGGAERSLLNTVRLLPRERYRASVVTFKEPEDPLVIAQFPCPVRVFPLRRTYGTQAVEVALNLRCLIRNERVAITQTLFESSDLWAGPIAKMSGCPVLISSRRDMGFRRKALHRAGYRLLNSLFDQVHTVSDAVRDFSIRQDGTDPSKTITILNGIDMDSACRTGSDASLRKCLGLEHASHLIVDVTSIRFVKGVDVLARTAAIVCQRYQSAIFLIVGRCADREYLKELNESIDRQGLRYNFRFVGGMENIFPILKICDVFCHLSRTDGLSNALLEAMAAGLPSVVSRAGGNPEVVEEGRSGFVVPVDHPELAADRVMTLLRHPDCAQRMGERGRQLASENFSAEVMVRRLVELYDRLLSPLGTWPTVSTQDISEKQDQLS